MLPAETDVTGPGRTLALDPDARYTRRVARHTHPLVVRFGDCDPAGIAYFPRIFDWFHQAMETWFEAHLGVPYDRVIREGKLGFPAVRTEAQFAAPCALGDRLVVELTVPKLGRRSMDLAYRVVGEDGVLRATGVTTVVVVCLDVASPAHLRPVDAPPELRAALERFAAGHPDLPPDRPTR